MVRPFRARLQKKYHAFNPGRLVPQGGTVIDRRFAAQKLEGPDSAVLPVVGQFEFVAASLPRRMAA